MEKYIVYKTTNLINSKFYIGVHKTENPEIFDGYIGNGIWVYKPHTYIKGKTTLLKAILKYGIKNFKRSTLQIFDTAEEAYYLESLIVDEEFLSRPDVYNMVLGGDLREYHTITVFKYDRNGKYIEEYPSIKAAAYSIKIRNSILSQAILYKLSCGGYYWSTVKVDFLDISKYSKPKKIYKVYIYNLDGSFYKEFNSCYQAKIELNIGGIERAAKLGYCIKENYYACFVKAETYSIARTTYIKNRPVFKYDSDGNFLCEYSTQLEAEKLNKNSNISEAIKSKQPDKNGFIWGLEKLHSYNKIIRKGYRKVGMFDDNGNLLKTWESSGKCISEVGPGVCHNLRGDYKKHKGYIFKYID